MFAFFNADFRSLQRGQIKVEYIIII
jgi:hypothetical protein